VPHSLLMYTSTLPSLSEGPPARRRGKPGSNDKDVIGCVCYTYTMYIKERHHLH
jgi:hypothetical protein